MLILVGVIVGPAGGIEGAKFDPALRDPSYTGPPETSAWLLDLSDGNLWLGAGVALAVTALVLFVAARRAPR